MGFVTSLFVRIRYRLAVGQQPGESFMARIPENGHGLHIQWVR
jgi:hypothetical protein